MAAQSNQVLQFSGLADQLKQAVQNSPLLANEVMDKVFRTLLLACAVCLHIHVANGQDAENTLNALEAYVQEEDDSYTWKVHSTEVFGISKNVVIDMTSQNWLTEDDVDRTEWKHWIILTIPSVIDTDIAVFLVNGGDNDGEVPDPNAELGLAAITARSILVDFRMVPNQPLVFHDDGVERSEDDLIAYAWRHLLDTNDMRFMPQAPMVKAIVRAMDTVTEYLASEEGGEIAIEEFVLTGGSKRGHVTWLAGALDERVVGIAPLVIDLLNTRESMLHHFATYGFWAAAVTDYVFHGVLQDVDCADTRKLIEVLDPINYSDRLHMPKLLVNAMGDQYFLPDSSRFYWDDLEGDKYLRYIPNTGHTLAGSDYLRNTLLSFYLVLKSDEPLPTYTWKHNADSTFEVSTDTEPTEVRFWQGTNETARDFRISTFGENFTSEVVEADSDGSYSVAVETPEVGWKAYMMELTWDLGGLYPLKLTTQAYVVPDHVPYPYKARNLPTTITLLCDATDQNHVSQLENYLSDLNVSHFTDSDLTVENRGTRLYINWKPNGRFDKADSFREDLASRDCEIVTYQLESGPDITFPPNSVE